MDLPITMELATRSRRMKSNSKLRELSPRPESVCAGLRIHSVNGLWPNSVMLTVAAGLAHRLGYLIPNWFVLGGGGLGTFATVKDYHVIIEQSLSEGWSAQSTKTKTTHPQRRPTLGPD